jgi:hypothetical protein
VPDRPWAWHTLQQIFAETEDPELLATARARWHGSLFEAHDATLEAARMSLRRGDERRARNQLLTLLAGLPRTLEFAPTLQALLEILPPGPAQDRHAEDFAGWLDWAVELCLLRECPLPQPSFSRLARLSGDLSPGHRATAFLLSGDLPRAQLVERRFTQTSRSDWAGYFLLKAEELARRGRLEEAQETLGKLPVGWRQRPRYWIARRELARLAEDEAAERASVDALEELGGTRWGRADWASGGSGARLELLVPEDTDGLRVTIAEATPRGAVVDILWDGGMVAVRRTTGSRGTVELEMTITSGLHRLEIVPQFGGSPRPTDVVLF